MTHSGNYERRGVIVLARPKVPPPSPNYYERDIVMNALQEALHSFCSPGKSPPHTNHCEGPFARVSLHLEFCNKSSNVSLTNILKSLDF